MGTPKASRPFDDYASVLRESDVAEYLTDMATAERGLSLINLSLLKAISAHVEIQDSQLMDLGCALGLSSLPFKNAGANVTCVDGSVNYLKWARKLNAGQRYVQKDVEKDKLPPVKGGYDAIYSSELFKYLARPEKTLKEIARLLRPGGISAFTIDLYDGCDTIKTGTFPDDPAYTKKDIPHFAHPKAKILDTMKQAGFEITSAQERAEDAFVLMPYSAKKHLIVARKLAL